MLRKAVLGPALAGLLLLAFPAPAAGEGGFHAAEVGGVTGFRHFGLEEGLGSLSINALAQDREGFLWIGTDVGVYRFDGERFLTFLSRDGLPADTVSRLWADPKGGVWVTTDRGLCHIEGTAVRPASSMGLPGEVALAYDRDGEGRLWLALNRGGLWREAAQGRFERVPGWDRARALAWAPRHGGLLVAGSEGRLELLKDGKTVQSWSGLGGAGTQSEAVLEDGEGRLWVLDREGLFQKALDASTFQALDHPVVRSGGQARTMAPDGRGGLWVATVHGLLQVNKHTLRPLTEREGLPARSATAVLVDREGGLWFAAGGLYHQRGLGAWRNHTPAQGLPTEVAWILARDARGRIWAATERGLAVLEGSRWRALPETAGLDLQGLVALPDGSLLAARWPDTLLRVAPGAVRSTRVPLPGGRARRVGIKLFLDLEGRPWILSDGLRRVEWTGSGLREVAFLPYPPEFQASGDAVLQDRQGRIWLAGTGGLLECHQGTWRRWGTAEGLLGDSLGGITEAPDGSLLVAYRDALGVTRFRRTAEGLSVIRHYRQSQGDLPTDAVFSVHVDPGSGRVWALTAKGAALLHEQGYELFGKAAGLANPDMVQGAFLVDPATGITWFGTSGGVLSFDPALHSWSAPMPAPVVTELRVGGRPVPLPRRGEALSVQPRENTIEALVGYLGFSRDGAHTYEVRLGGLEADWHEERVPKLRYPALPPGSYRLEVRALLDGRRGPETSVPFEVLPRWYQTWTFRILAFLSAGPLLWGALVWRNRHLRLKNARLEALVQSRTQELEVANQKLQELSLTDPLTGLHNRRFLSLTLPEQMARIQRDLLPPGTRERERPFLADHPLVFLVLDIDHFKHVNDEYGHQAGDEVLRQISDILRTCVRDTDTLIRWGGEEFLVVARQVGSSDPAGLAERIRKALEDHLFALGDGRALRKTISIGFCPYPLGHQVPSLPWEKAVLLADRALYAVKRTGRNGWIGLDEGPAFDADVLLSYAGHPDIPQLIRDGVLHVVTSFEAVPPDAWI